MEIRFLLKGSERTNFRYSIEGGMDARDKDEYESMDPVYVNCQKWPRGAERSIDIRHRLRYLRERHLGFGYLGLSDPAFEAYLVSIDSGLPITLGYMLSDLYLSGTGRISDMLDNVERDNPAEHTGARDDGYYRDIVGHLLLCLLDASGIGSSTDMHTADRNGHMHSFDSKKDLISHLFENSSFDRIPADVFGCTAIDGSVREGYRTELTMQIIYNA